MLSDWGATFEGPPCESQIERDVEWRLQKYLAKDVRVERQALVATEWESSHVDFVIHTRGLRIGLECDEASSNEDAWRDEWRDAVALGSGALDEVIRFTGQDIQRRADDCIYLLARMHLDAFTARGVNILERLASKEAGEAQLSDGERLQYFAPVTNGDDDLVRAQDIVRVLRRRRDAARQYWQKLYAAAVEIGPCTLDEVMARDEARWMKPGTDRPRMSEGRESSQRKSTSRAASWERDWDGWFAASKPRRGELLVDWMHRVRAAASNATAKETSRPGVPEWSNYDDLLPLHREAEVLRTLDDSNEWKVPFNRFRGIFLRRHAEALSKFVCGDEDPAFWLAFEPSSFEPEA